MSQTYHSYFHPHLLHINTCFALDNRNVLTYNEIAIEIIYNFPGKDCYGNISHKRRKSIMFSSRTAALRLGVAVAAIAGIWTLIHIILGLAGVTADDFWGYALLILFVIALIVAFVQYAQERSALQASGASERFPEPSISRFFTASEGSSSLWFVVRMYVGAEWLLAGWEKVTSPAWGGSGKALGGFVAGALAKSTGANPAVQGWYAWFLQHMVTPNAGLFSFLVSWGELAVGLGILLGILTGIAAGFGILMNMNYLLAGTVSINPILGVLGLFLVISWRVCGWIGIDRVLLPALGLPWKPGTLFHTPEIVTHAPPTVAHS
jgi:thiosulfate dehydrogenase (quinone) large subunit